MITRITRGNDVAGLGRYLHGPGRANEHVYAGVPGGAVIGGNLAVEGDRDPARWVHDFQMALGGRPDVAKGVWHMSMRAAPGDRTLTDAQWADAAQSMGEQMGWDQHPWVVVRHGEDHVHVVVSRVGWDRSLWAGRNDYRAAQAARQIVERDLGLQAAPVRAAGARSVTPGEDARSLRTGQVPPRQQLATQVGAVAEGARGSGRGQFEELLDGQGVRWRANVASTGRMSGYSFGLPGHVDAGGEQVWFKASQLDRSLAWKTLQGSLEEPIVDPDPPKPPRKRLETPRRHAQRAEAVVRQAQDAYAAQKRTQRLAGVGPEAARRAAAQRLAAQARSRTSPRTTVPAERRRQRDLIRQVRKFQEMNHPTLTPAQRTAQQRRGPSPDITRPSVYGQPTSQPGQDIGR